MSGYQGRRLLVDDFHVGPVLGTGGFSIVRVGVRKQDRLQVAIKTLKKFGYGRRAGGPAPQRMSQAEALVKNEILVMMRIVDRVSPHPNVIHLVDVYEDADAVHLVLELCKGGELFDRIVAQERYSERDAAAVVRQIASGLSMLHQAHIVHRDLKPENCLFADPTPQSPLKIMDFGLSYIHNVTNSVVGIFGSIDYMAPEQLNLSAVSPANDMWSLGVILYILLCGSASLRQTLIPTPTFDVQFCSQFAFRVSHSG
jgi:calcium-dependent protein kinase